MPPVLATLGASQFHLCGNGAMIEEFPMALSDMSEEHIYNQPYFDARRRPDRAVLDHVRARFVARDLVAHQTTRAVPPRARPRQRRPFGRLNVVRRIPASVSMLAGCG